MGRTALWHHRGNALVRYAGNDEAAIDPDLVWLDRDKKQNRILAERAVADRMLIVNEGRA